MFAILARPCTAKVAVYQLLLKYYGCFEWMHHALSFKAAARERAAAVKEAKKQARRERWEKNQEEKQARIEEIERMQRVSVSLLYL